MQIDIKNQAGSSSGQTLELGAHILEHTYSKDLIHQVVTAYLNAGRSGTKAQKTRAEVRGGGAKPWRQKGTGRARAGTSSSPIWRGGGRAFAAKPRDYSQKVNRKMYQAAMRAIWCELLRSERVVIVDKLELPEPKTKQLNQILRDIGTTNVLIVTDEVTENLCLAARNLVSVDVKQVGFVDPVSLLSFEKVLIAKAALSKIEGLQL